MDGDRDSVDSQASTPHHLLYLSWKLWGLAGAASLWEECWDKLIMCLYLIPFVRKKCQLFTIRQCSYCKWETLAIQVCLVLNKFEGRLSSFIKSYPISGNLTSSQDLELGDFVNQEWDGEISRQISGLQSNTCMYSELSHFSRVWLFVTLWTVACQAPLSMRFSRQEEWSGLPCPPPGDLPHPGIKSTSFVSCIGR